MRLAAILALPLLLALLFPFSLLAQDASRGPDLKLSGSHIGRAEFSDDRGKVAVTSGRADISWRFLQLSYENVSFSWSDKHRLPFGDRRTDPWDSFHHLRLAANHQERIDERWGWFAGAALTSSFEREMSGSFGAALRGGASYALDEQWTMSFGAAFFANPVNLRFWPFLAFGFDGRDGEGRGFFASLGMPQASLGYGFDKTLSLTLSGGWNSDFARLRDGSPVRPKGYVTARGIHTALLLEWRPVRAFSLALGPTYDFARKYTFYRKNGDRQDSHSLDPALGGRLELRYRF
ncbi:hypothetical protein dsat_0329 [Alkalidesulfovibrio alkalitolerans DSM 16529]|uniref:Uncharacterized protein n=1 Tax=Alkalidesulfovibrio alkalitolerans DSM 16529 TaxID=1121439 RepID=S7UKQ2_9BACT|nr:hypothetical protein [Alkalidesulfovibrio alkalitolerans]EPR32888.1 hypothetical protein dsat_0329 [Alkalidesulfovibrio alkalitolerans DSM 16529]